MVEVDSPTVVVADGQLHPYHDFEYERTRWAAQGFKVILGTCRTEADVIDVGREADAIAFWSLDLPFTERVFQDLARCRVVVRYGTGVESVDLQSATRQGVLVAAPLGYCTREVADHTTALILSLSRRVTFLDRHMRDGGWRPNSPLITNVRRLSSQTLGLIGFGRIAQQVARNMKPIVGSLATADPYVDSTTAREIGVDVVDLEALLANSDFVSVHVPQTDQTTHMLGRAELAKMKSNAFLVNTSRGAVIEESDLIEALESKTIAGAALDVFTDSPLPTHSRLRSLDNIVLTPHFSGNSEEAKSEMYAGVVEIVGDALGGQRPNGVLNPAVYSKH